MNGKRVSLYERLPEIYRTKDAEQLPPDQLKSYLATVEAAFGAIHENIESLYSSRRPTPGRSPTSAICSALRTSRATRGRCAPTWRTQSLCDGARARSAQSNCSPTT
jgi:hypothetical protein